jgi:hypothetical protein
MEKPPASIGPLFVSSNERIGRIPRLWSGAVTVTDQSKAECSRDVEIGCKGKAAIVDSMNF